MISIIICSRRADISDELRTNIATTIGCEYELCVIDNSSNSYNIFTAYNEGVKRAKGDVLCFMHDDIRFVSEEWGRAVHEVFDSDATVGCVGVVGTHLMPDTPSGWYHSMLTSGGCIQNTGGKKTNLQDLSHFQGKTLIEAVAIDGMWFCVSKKVFDESNVLFDDATYNGFHCYDLDICMQIRAAGYKVMIASQILLEHSSLGSFDMAWWGQTQLFYNKWRKTLPQNAGMIVSDKEIEVRTQMVKQVMVWLTCYAKSESERKGILSSKAYRLGKALLSPFSFLKRR